MPNRVNISTHEGLTSYDQPVWEADGQGLLVEAGFGDQTELYYLSRDGTIKRLTYLTEIYEYTRVRGYGTSFDGRYIAFLYWADPYVSYRLAIMDKTTG